MPSQPGQTRCRQPAKGHIRSGVNASDRGHLTLRFELKHQIMSAPDDLQALNRLVTALIDQRNLGTRLKLGLAGFIEGQHLRTAIRKLHEDFDVGFVRCSSHGLIVNR